MIDYRKIIKNRELRLKLIYTFTKRIPDVPYLKLVYRVKTGQKLDLKNPKGFNEKLNWLKLNHIHPEYELLVDKYLVRDYIKEKLGEEYLFPILGKWETFEEIDFDNLPEKFVLKCNHDSGSVKIIKKSENLDYEGLKKFFDGRIKRNPYYDGREYPYKNVKPLIIAEQFMQESFDSDELRDYKFYCFNGEPKFLYLSQGLSHHDEARISFVTLDWEIAPFRRLDFTGFDELPQKPSKFEEMIEICRKLTSGMEFVRLDLYEINGRIYFGEFTFFPSGGYTLLYPDEWEKKIGDLIKI